MPQRIVHFLNRYSQRFRRKPLRSGQYAADAAHYESAAGATMAEIMLRTSRSIALAITI
jgi:hypothetical protein